VGDPACRQRQGRDRQQDDEENREALLLEELDEAADGLPLRATEPAL
jgi:hypothetical protein